MKKLSSYFQQQSSNGEPTAKKPKKSTVNDNPVAVGKLNKKRNSLDGYNTENVDEAQLD